MLRLPPPFAKILSSQLRRNMASGVAVSLINSGAAFVGYPIYVHYLGLDFYGVWLVLATFMQFAMLGDLGISHALTKLIAEGHARKDIAAIQNYATASILTLAVSGALILLAILAAPPAITGFFELSSQHEHAVSRLLPYMGLFSAYTVLNQVYYAGLSGIERMDTANYIQTAGRVGGVAIATSLLACNFGIEAMLLGTAANCVLTHIACVFAFRRLAGFPLLRFGLPNRAHFVKILSFGGGILAASLLNLILNPLNKLLLCKYCGVASIPVYEIGFRIAQQIRAIAIAALRALMPEVSRISASNIEGLARRLSSLNRRANRFLLLTSIPCYLCTLFVLKPALSTWLAPSLAEPLFPVLSVMLLGTFVSLASAPSYFTLMGMGQIRPIFVASLIKATTNASACLAILAFTASVSPLALAWSVMIALSVTTLYLISQHHRLIASLSC